MRTVRKSTTETMTTTTNSHWTKVVKSRRLRRSARSQFRHPKACRGQTSGKSSSRVVKLTPEPPPSISATKPAKRTAKAPAKKVPASKPKAAENPVRKRKAEDAGIEQPQRHQIPRHQNMTTSLFNMKETFYMGRDMLLKDMDGSACLFYQQAHRPGFSAG